MGRVSRLLRSLANYYSNITFVSHYIELTEVKGDDCITWFAWLDNNGKLQKIKCHYQPSQKLFHLSNVSKTLVCEN